MERCEALIQIPITSKEQLAHLFEAEKHLSRAGVTFDTGAGCGMRDWEFDWSLKGATVLFKKNYDGNLPSGKPIVGEDAKNTKANS